MRDYGIVYRKTFGSGQDFGKWIPSADLELMVHKLYEVAQRGTQESRWLPIPLLLTLAAYLEAYINDWLIIDTFNKHGQVGYKPLAEGYLRIPFSNKLRAVVSILTDNAFQVREESQTVKTLDELIAVRNRLVHPKAFFLDLSEDTPAGSRPRLFDHPISTITLDDCKPFMEAVRRFEDDFFNQYDRGHIQENQLIREIPKILRPETSPAED